MSVSIDSTVRISANAWRVGYSSDQDDPTFYVYRDGRFVAATRATHYDFLVAPGESLVVQVLDSVSDAAANIADGRVELHWNRVAGADHYRIDGRRA